MGQTLSHGVYLPAEGERNCYSGLASNWNLLDTAIGDTAGKASATHSHGNITNDGKVGTSANKPLITGTGGAVQAGSFGTSANTFCEGNDSRLSDARTPVAHTHGKADITDLFNSANTWSNINTIQREITIAGDRNAYIAPMWSGVASGIAFLSMDAGKQFVFGQRTTDANNRYCYDATKGYLVLKTGIIGESNYVEVTPHGSDTRLGDSTNRWTTLNGINPGALSLPDTLGASGTENVNYFNVIGYLNNTGTLATIPTTATYDGWLYINAKDGADSYIIVDDSPSSFGTSVFGNNGLGAQSIGLLCLMCPIRKGHSYNVRIKSAGIVSARIYPAQGNV